MYSVGVNHCMCVYSTPNMLGCSVNSWFVAKPDESPVHFPAGFHFDDYPVNQDLKNLIANVDAD